MTSDENDTKPASKELCDRPRAPALLGSSLSFPFFLSHNSRFKKSAVILWRDARYHGSCLKQILL